MIEKEYKLNRQWKVVFGLIDPYFVTGEVYVGNDGWELQMTFGIKKDGCSNWWTGSGDCGPNYFGHFCGANDFKLFELIHTEAQKLMEDKERQEYMLAVHDYFNGDLEGIY